MKLPGAERVRIDERKVLEYLLSKTHPVGRCKARVFGAVGFSEATAGAFVAELRRIARQGEVGLLIEGRLAAELRVDGQVEARVE